MKISDLAPGDWFRLSEGWFKRHDLDESYMRPILVRTTVRFDLHFLNDEPTAVCLISGELWFLRPDTEVEKLEKSADFV